LGRLIWAIAVAILTFILQTQFFLSSAIFWALFCLSPTAILLDIWWPSVRFEWKQFREKISLESST
jgi:hypothetical protein